MELPPHSPEKRIFQIKNRSHPQNPGNHKPEKSKHTANNQYRTPAPNSFFARARAIVSWLLGASHIRQENPPLQQLTDEEQEKIDRMCELKKYSHQDVLQRAAEALKKLELTKKTLVDDFGQAALGFIFRHIDPIIHSTKTLLSSLESLREKDKEQRTTAELTLPHSDKEIKLPELLEGAVDAVELYAIMHDEEHLKKKILHNIELHTHQAIIKDIQILKAYQTTASQELIITEIEKKHEIISLIEKELDSIIVHLQKLTEDFPHSYDFAKLFEWRRIFDEKRNSLVSLATFLVDLYLVKYSFFAPYYGVHGEKESEGLVTERVIFITDSQINSSSFLLNRFINIELLLIALKLHVNQLKDPLLECHICEITNQLNVLVSDLCSITFLSRQDNTRLTDYADAVKNHLVQLASASGFCIV